jgi:hypothetical protein
MPGLRRDRLPLTYAECRARFRAAAEATGVPYAAHSISPHAPDGEGLTIDVVAFGSPDASRALVVLSGVHGVEGFLPSTLQTDAMLRWGAQPFPDDVGVLLVHTVNPWGMAWGRRQNESNVDLNRNWRRDNGVPFHNDAYDALHDIACPDTAELPPIQPLFEIATQLVAERGLPWVRDAITVGQYRHPDGLHFGGDRTEASNRALEHIVHDHLAHSERVLIIDLHTGHGPRGEITALSDAPPNSAQHAFLSAFIDRVEATVDNPDATTARKAGQIANGIRDELVDCLGFSTSLEFGTSSDLDQLQATYQEQWVHNHGNRADPTHMAAVRSYRECFTPDDPEWEHAGFVAGRELLARAFEVVATW